VARKDFNVQRAIELASLSSTPGSIKAHFVSFSKEATIELRPLSDLNVNKITFTNTIEHGNDA